MKLLLFFLALGATQSLLATDIWEQRADFGGIGRHRGTGIGVNNRAYAGLGHQNGNGIDIWFADWWEYDPATNSWTQKSDYPGNNGLGDENAVAVALGNVIYAGLGQHDTDAFYKYDPLTNTWTLMAAPPVGNTFWNTAPFSVGNIGYFPGLFSNKLFSYNPATNQWTQMADIPFSTSYGTPGFAVGEKGYLKNGADFYCYDPVLNSWSTKATFPGLYPNRPIGVAQSSYGFFIGGFQGNPLTLPWEWAPEVWRYDPATDSWLRMPDFPGTTRRWTVAMNVNDHVYYGLGTNGTNFNDFWEFSSTAGHSHVDADNFIVAPNPATDHVDFSSKDQLEFELELQNAQGQKISEYSSQLGKIRIERDNLSGGIYFGVVRRGDIIYSAQRIVFL